MRVSRRVQNLGESATFEMSRRAQELRDQGKDVVSFGAGQPDLPTPAHIVEAAKTALDQGRTGYAVPTSGLAASKEAVAGKLARENGLKYDRDQIIITVGGKEALYLAFAALLDDGDEVVIPAPYWVTYPEQVKLAGGIPVVVPGDEGKGFCITPQQLEGALTDRTRVVVLNYPSNPGGSSYTAADLRALARVLEAREVVVFSDEMYDRLVYGSAAHVSWASLDERLYQRTVTFNAVSKTYSMTGWRLGYAAGPADLIEAMGRLQGQITSGTVHFCQYGLIAALSGEQDCVEAMRREYDRRRRQMYQGLLELPGVSCVEPTGAFYCFPNVSRCCARLGVDGSVGFCRKLLDEQCVAAVPGAAFGCDAHVRLSYAVGPETIAEGLRRLRCFLAA